MIFLACFPSIWLKAKAVDQTLRVIASYFQSNSPLVDAMKVQHGGAFVVLLCLRRVVASVDDCESEVAALDLGLMQAHVARSRGSSSVWKDEKASTTHERLSSKAVDSNASMPPSNEQFGNNTLDRAAAVADSTSGQRSYGSSSTLEEPAPLQLKQQLTETSAMKSGALDGRAKTQILGISLGNIIMLLVIVAFVLAGLYLLWGGNVEELKQHPTQVLQNTAQQVYNDPSAAWQKTSRAAPIVGEAAAGLGIQPQPPKKTFGCC